MFGTRKNRGDHTYSKNETSMKNEKVWSKKRNKKEPFSMKKKKV